jgi:hypothetical protein
MAAFIVRVSGSVTSESVNCGECTKETLAANPGVQFELVELGDLDREKLRFKECDSCDAALNSNRIAE